MDDGKCLLDVISDPQALKEFFRSTSQIAFVEGKVPHITDEIGNNKQDTNKDISRSDSTTFTTCNPQTSNTSKPSSTLSGQSDQQTKPLAHFSFPASSSNLPSSFLANVQSPVKNGLQNNTGTNNLTTASSLRAMTVTAASPNLQKLASSVQNATSSNVGTIVSSSQTAYANSPLSFPFSNMGKARNVLSSGSVSLSSVEKPMAVSAKQSISQQLQDLAATPPRLISSPQAGLNTTILAQNLKGSPLPTLRPKGVIQRQQQNATSPLLGEQRNSQITIQGNIHTPGLKTKPIIPIKGQQQLVAIRPKLIIAQPNATGSQTNLGNSTTKSKQSLQSSFTLGANVQPRLPKQILNSMTVPQVKPGVSNQPVGKGSLASLVQLQPKQIAPKQVATVQSVGASKVNQEQANLQLVQSLLAQNQAQFGMQTSVGQKDPKQATSMIQENLTQQQNIQQQNQLKKLLQQQVMLARAQQPHTQQQQHTTQQTQSQQQNSMALLQMKSPPPSAASSLLASQQQKLPSSQSVSASNLANQLKEAINAKQLQQFLEKNPVVAQQLKQLNMRQAGLNTVSTTGATPVKTVAQLQKPATTPTQLPKPTVVQLQKPVTNLLQKPVVGVTNLQKPVTSIAHLQKPVTSIAQLTKPAATAVTHVTIPTPRKLNTVTSSGQVTQPQKTDQKPVTTQQKVVIVQPSSATAAVSTAQTKVLLQTKEGRPILLSQEQFRQIQAQLASKNLSIQGKLVTATPTTTTTATVKPQIVVKTSEASSTKPVGQKVVSATAKPQVKQEVTKSAKRPIKAVETEESKLIKRMKLSVQKDQNDVCFTDIHKPFKTHQDAIKRLTAYHVYSEPTPNARMERKANMLLDKLALQLTHKSDKMINKYRQLLLRDMQRDIPSAELVMVNRIFLADEKAALLKDKQAVLEKAKQMAQSSKVTHSPTKNTLTNANISETTTTNQLSTLSTPGHQTSLPKEVSEPAQIEISDDDSSPMTSANSFLTHVTRTDCGLINETLEPG